MRMLAALTFDLTFSLQPIFQVMSWLWATVYVELVSSLLDLFRGDLLRGICASLMFFLI